MHLIRAIKAFFAALTGKEKQIAGPVSKHEDLAHLRLLALLQQKGRLIDFLKEDLSSYTDAQVGAAVRQLHQACHQELEQLVAIRPLRDEAEGSRVTIPAGYSPLEVKVVGKVSGKPPYEGILRHKGWRAHKTALPRQVGEREESVLMPAEVEVQ
jgi:Domain of unknown function (DUF2760)